MTKDFNNWWNSDLTLMNNPYTEDTPAYWAWAGWVAGAKAEREACEEIATNNMRNTVMLISNPPKSAAAWDIRNAIRARGEA